MSNVIALKQKFTAAEAELEAARAVFEQTKAAYETALKSQNSNNMLDGEKNNVAAPFATDC